MVEKPYLTVEEVAEMLQVSVETVRGYISKKKNPLPAFKLGREWRIPTQDFNKWVREQMNKPDTD